MRHLRILVQTCSAIVGRAVLLLLWLVLLLLLLLLLAPMMLNGVVVVLVMVVHLLMVVVQLEGAGRCHLLLVVGRRHKMVVRLDGGSRMVQGRGGRKVVVVRLGGEHGRLARRRHLVLFLVFHSAILEPNLDLALGQCQIVRYLNAPPTSQILVEVELLLQLQCLVSRVGLSGSLVARTRVGLLHPGIDLAALVAALGVQLVHLDWCVGLLSGST